MPCWLPVRRVVSLRPSMPRWQGILFVMEEMRPQFRYSFLAIKAVGISAVMATLMLQNMKGQSPSSCCPTTTLRP